MFSFIICIVVLVVGYFVYGKLMTRIFGPDDSRKTPAVEHPDGVDYIPMPTWKIFLIQFLNIAGVGPIFGAILGAKYGTASFLWIVLGSIFAGGVHDYISGMLSVRNNGASMPEVVGKYLGKGMGQFMRFYGVLLLVLVGVVFVASPAGLLARLTPNVLNSTWWIVIIFLYYILATLLPIDKIIGKIYPVFAIAMLFMAVGIMGALFVHWPSEIPELTEGMQNINPNGLPIFPFVFVSIACGAVSGFHGTQNPLMARCMKKESEGRPVFYGAMITEGIVALIWAAAATYFYHSDSANLAVNDAATVVFDMSKHWLGVVGGVLAILGVVAAPITSGDTAFRSSRLIIADALGLPQTKIRNRFLICIPLFIVGAAILFFSLAKPEGFNVLWRYFAWTNQTFAAISLWTCTVYLALRRKPYVVTLLPAMFMTVVCTCYIIVAPEGFRLAQWLGVTAGLAVMVILFLLFLRWRSRLPKTTIEA